MPSQSEIIKRMTDKELSKQIIFSQLLLIVVSLLSSLILFDNMVEWFGLFRFNLFEIAYYGILPGLIIVVTDIILIYIFPRKYYDDGGINDRIFRNRSIIKIFTIALLVAVSEEILFRGVIQTTFGYVIASIIFALIHIRYLKKPVLLLSVLVVSFYIGYIFVLTEILLVTITAHFIVDFLLGVVIRFKSEVLYNE
ncbi:CPBP family intramembrane glutamic endopeptidase [Virgibacillus litoralis]|uniref:Membrane protease YdiL (CAAX protease family) n=1 Tax=Virgibacillus litoralis TaxID=578221 RepID=A0ABS4HF44_9BACI|nr:CPBP family intramembrane glutamic endopeptidase [Virgibacillus litoralis]MBP1949535.1 membrane protease YdiL (CAAX protease family) [Virgibacillus litoralis]